MKIKDIKKQLGKGILIWVEACKEDWDDDFEGRLPGIIVHHPLDVEYDSLCLYPFENFIKMEETESKIVKFICNKFSIDKVFAYQPCLVTTNEQDKVYTLFCEKYNNKIYDVDCSYLISVKKKVADSISFDGDEYVVSCN